MTLQETYDAIRAHFTRPDAVLAKQHENPNAPVCFYRKDSDPKSPVRCAVGVMIPDEMYVPGMDQSGSLNGLLDSYPELIPALGITTDEDGDPRYDDPILEFLYRAQSAHDTTLTITTSDFIEQLDRLARELRLGVPA